MDRDLSDSLIFLLYAVVNKVLTSPLITPLRPLDKGNISKRQAHW